MKVTQEKLPASQIGLEIEISPELSKSTYEKVVKEFSESINLPGFRKGKVPRAVLLQRLGSNRIKGAVLEELVQDSLQLAIKQESIEALGNYQLVSDFEQLVKIYELGEAITVKVSVDVPPVVELGQYQGLNVKAEEVLYDPKDVDDFLLEQRNRLATIVPVEDRAAQMGDLAFVDFKGRKAPNCADEEPVYPEGLEATDFQVDLSEGKFIPGFAEGIVGMNIGETKDIPLTFPNDYPEESLRNESVIFTVTLKEIKERELPELDDDFAKEVSDFETLEGFKASLEKQYQDRAETEAKYNLHKAIADELVKHTTIDLPVTLIEEEVQNLLIQTASRMESYGMNVNQIFTKEMIPTMKEKIRPDAINNITQDLIFKAIAEKESITFSDEEFAERETDMRKNLKGKDIDEAKLKKVITDDLISEKTLAWLETKNTIELVPQGTLTPDDAVDVAVTEEKAE